MPARAREESESDDDLQLVTTKRRRLDFGKGSITRVRVRNFMTYTVAEFTPGPRLNLVLGPNGSGKSSLVSAICLGLGGTPKLLARADNLRDFVLRGESNGSIEIWIRTNSAGSERRITRLLDRSSNTSQWKIDGGTRTLKEVLELVEKLGIQLNNLCQFMPQDRVAEFARLKPCELLEETERAIGGAELYQLHHQLIKGRKEFVALETGANSNQAELGRLQKENESLKRDVSRFENRAKLEADIADLEGRSAWLEYETKKQDHIEYDQMLKRAQRSCKSLEEKTSRDAAPLKEKEAKMKAADKAANKAKSLLSKAKSDIEKAHADIEEFHANLQDNHQQIQTAGEDYAKQQVEIQRLQQEVETARTNLEEHLNKMSQSQLPDHTEQIKDLRIKGKDMQRNLDRIRGDIDGQHDMKGRVILELKEAEDRKKRFSDAKQQRLQQLEIKAPGLRKFVNRLTPELRAQFKLPIFGPVAMEIAVDGDQNARWLESCIGQDLWSRYIVQCPEDQEMLYQIANQFHYKPSITCFHGNAEAAIPHPQGEASQYAAHNVIATLDTLFDAPLPVKSIMCQEAYLNLTYCGSQAFNANKFLDDYPAIRRALTPESKHIVTVSRYSSNARSTAIGPVYHSRLLKAGATKAQEEELAKLDAEIQEKKRESDIMAAEINTLERANMEVKAAKSEVEASVKALEKEQTAAKKRKDTLNSKVHVAEAKLKAKQKAKDPRLSIPNLKKANDAFVQNICAKMSELVKSYKDSVGFRTDHIVQSAAYKEFQHQAEELQKACRQANANIDSYKRQIKDLLSNIKSKKQELEELLQGAESLTGPMTDELKEKHAGLPASQQAISELIQTKQNEIEGIHMANPRAMAEFNKRKSEIQTLEKEVAKQSEKVEGMKAKLLKTQEAWLPELRETVKQINSNFQECFRKIGCVGEVQLHEEDSPLSVLQDFEKFAIQIKVKYRATETLQILDQHRQSGGERSVATILYLISLQSVTVCPFRVVDEINQGMDPINERKCFMQLVESATQPETPQCFLLTPKLLPNLPYSEHITLLQINNGALIKEAAKNFEKGMLIGRRPMVAAH